MRFRENERMSGRKRIAISLTVSAIVHAVVLGTLTIGIPEFETPERSRPLEVVELASEWTDRAIEVVPLEREPEVAESAEAAGSGTPDTPLEVVDVEAPPTVAPSLPSASVDLIELATAPESTPLVVVPAANRGVIQRSDTEDARVIAGRAVDATDSRLLLADAGTGGRGRSGNGSGGLGGIGISILGIGQNGPGADGCSIGSNFPGMPGGKPGGPSLPGITTGQGPSIGNTGGLGSLPSQGKGKGIIGCRPDLPGGGAAINRAFPSPGR